MKTSRNYTRNCGIAASLVFLTLVLPNQLWAGMYFGWGILVSLCVIFLMPLIYLYRERQAASATEAGNAPKSFFEAIACAVPDFLLDSDNGLVRIIQFGVFFITFPILMVAMFPATLMVGLAKVMLTLFGPKRAFSVALPTFMLLLMGLTYICIPLAPKPSGPVVVTETDHRRAVLVEPEDELHEELVSHQEHEASSLGVTSAIPDGDEPDTHTSSAHQHAKETVVERALEKLSEEDSDELVPPSFPETGPVRSVAFSVDGKLLLAGGSLGDDEQTAIAVLWDTTTGEKTQTFQIEGHSAGFASVAISPDGSMILSGSEATTAILWDVATAEQIHVLAGHTAEINGVAFNADGKKAITASDDSTSIIWDTATGNRILSLEGHTGGVNVAALSPDGTLAITGSRDSTARLWDATTGNVLFVLDGETKSVTAVSFSRDGGNALAGSIDGKVIRFDLRGTENLIATYSDTRVMAVVYDDDHNTILHASMSGGDTQSNRKVWVWEHDGERGVPLGIVSWHGVTELASRFAWEEIVAGYPTMTYSAVGETVRQKPPVTIFNHHSWVTDAEREFDDRLPGGPPDHSPNAMLLTRQREQHFLRSLERPCFCVAFSSDGTKIATGSSDMTVVLWDTEYAKRRD